MIADVISLTVTGFRLWRGTYSTFRTWEARPLVLRWFNKLLGAWHRT
jgi:hypothetical protein